MDEFKAYIPSSTKIPMQVNKKYHVFLSFRGPDVRKTLVDHLFESLSTAGVHVFVDNERLEKGKIIGLSLKEAIEDTVIHIPIFSKNYAQSTWCLDEVTQMCASNGLVIPLFYDVQPSDVRYPRKGEYAQAFDKHYRERRYTEDTISAWISALHQVSSLSGWTMETTSGYEGKLVKRVVLDVLKTLNNVPMDVTKCAVGLNERMNDLMKMGLSDRVTTIGIWGMGGIGKTTLTKAVYNNICHRFEASCFVADVRDNKLTKLQRQILGDILGVDIKVNNVDHGKSLMKARLQSTRALVVLDDIDHPKQLEALGGEWFGAGSRVIVTTRDEHVLNIGQADAIYTMKGLNDDQSLQLFSWHAFLRACPDEDYKDLARRVVNSCSGLPLSLEVVGSFLYDKKERIYWIEALRQLESVMYDDIRGRLEISYQALNSQEKEMFLDIAYFSIGKRKESPNFFWESLGFTPHTALKNLIHRSLVSINHEDRFVMHDHLRDMGRAIIAEESGELGKRSRLWKAEDAKQVLQKRLGTQSVRCISFRGGRGISEIILQSECFALMPNLQLLWLDGTYIGGDFGQLSLNLRWLRWKSCPLRCLPSEWNLEHVAVLDLSTKRFTDIYSSCINELWCEKSHHKKPKSLKVLRLKWCQYLAKLPDLSIFTSLRKLDLKHCDKLKTIPDSIGFLVQLRHLNLSNCTKLEKLPETIRKLSSLELFSLNWCCALKRLPTAVGEIGSALQELQIEHCLIRELPPFPGLPCLEKLSLYGCNNLTSLPKSIGQLKCLRFMDMSSCWELSSLPEEFGNLVNLKYLRATDTRLIRLPDSFSLLRSLSELNASCCGLPQQIGNLSSLEILNLHESSFHTLPLSICKLVQLSTLILSECKNLLELPSLPEGLVKVDIGDCAQWTRISDISHLKMLETFELYNCISLVELPELSLCKSLREVNICGCKNVTSLVGVEGLTSLRKFYLSGCGISVFSFAQWMKNMPYLQEFNISANGVPEILEHQTMHFQKLSYYDFQNIFCFPLTKKTKCIGIILCFVLKFKDVLVKTLPDPMEMSILIDGEEVFRNKVFGNNQRAEGDQLYVSIYREDHPLVMRLESATRICINAKGEEQRIRAAGMQLLYQNSTEESDDTVLERLEREFNMLLHNYNDKMHEDLVYTSDDDFYIPSPHECHCKEYINEYSEDEDAERRYMEQLDHHVDQESNIGEDAEVSPCSSYLPNLQGPLDCMYGSPSASGRSISPSVRSTSPSDINLCTDNMAELKIIYQTLNYEEKEIFLDIACFFLGKRVESPLCFWESLGFAPDISISNLLGKSLLNVNYENRFVMHDNLRDLGRAIVAEESEDLGKRSRLWRAEDAQQVLKKRLGTQSVRCISFQGGRGISEIILQSECLASMQNLQLLWLDGSYIKGDFGQLSPNLRWIRWKSCPLKCLPSEWNLEHLAVLDLSTKHFTDIYSSCINKLWCEKPCIKRPENLKVLKLKSCIYLNRLPDFSTHSSLIILDVRDCTKLKTIPESIGLLAHLRYLNLAECKNLEALPESFRSLSSLEQLSLKGCHKLKTLPNALGELQALKELKIQNYDMTELPPFCRTQCLERLILHLCTRLTSLPALVGDLKCLHYLDISCCNKLCYLPDEFGNLVNLRIMKAKSANLKCLPESFSRLRLLVELDASYCGLESGLPEQIGNLSSLEILNLKENSFHTLPWSVSELSGLTTLNLNGCKNLLELPTLPEGLMKVDIGNCLQLSRISDMSHLKKLESFELYKCKCLIELPNLLSCESLREVNMSGCKSIMSLEGIEGLNSLQKLCLNSCHISLLYLTPWMKGIRHVERKYEDEEDEKCHKSEDDAALEYMDGDVGSQYDAMEEDYHDSLYDTEEDNYDSLYETSIDEGEF